MHFCINRKKRRGFPTFFHLRTHNSDFRPNVLILIQAQWAAGFANALVPSRNTLFLFLCFQHGTYA